MIFIQCVAKSKSAISTANLLQSLQFATVLLESQEGIFFCSYGIFARYLLHMCTCALALSKAHVQNHMWSRYSLHYIWKVRRSTVFTMLCSVELIFDCYYNVIAYKLVNFELHVVGKRKRVHTILVDFLVKLPLLLCIIQGICQAITTLLSHPYSESSLQHKLFKVFHS